jgi:hypothetical protein
MRAAVDFLAECLFVNTTPETPAINEADLHPTARVLLECCAGFALMMCIPIVRAAQLPPSRGYEPFLVANGYDPFVARGLAELAVRSGKRQAKESKSYRRVVDAIRFLSSAGRQRRAILSRAKLLVEAWNETSIVETLFDDARLSEREFISLLEKVLKGEAVDLRRLTEIAAELAPHLSLARGPKPSAPSAAHEFLIDGGILDRSTKRSPYRQRSRSDDYCDALTEATRKEFDAPHFDSRPARRRSKRMKPTK